MNFDGDNLNKDLLKTECKIQKEIFKHALNKNKKQVLKRYSDKYTQALPTNKEKIKNLVYHEILPKELQDALLKHKINIERTENIEEEVSSESEVVESNEDENDYNKNYYDEDEEEFVDEDVKGEDDYE